MCVFGWVGLGSPCLRSCIRAKEKSKTPPHKLNRGSCLGTRPEPHSGCVLRADRHSLFGTSEERTIFLLSLCCVLASSCDIVICSARYGYG